MKRATHRFATAGEVAVISIHALVKRATRQDTVIRNCCSYFNPRPREEGDLLPFGAERKKRYISIHALVKRATVRDTFFNASLGISIHALVKRATQGNFSGACLAGISIHALVKRATSHFAFIAFQLVISIHALVKRATGGEIRLIMTCGISIHALVKRATCDTRPVGAGRGHFNPRPREEGDKDIQNFKRRNIYFNPRPREEGDTQITGKEVCVCISIHALVKRATL